MPKRPNYVAPHSQECNNLRRDHFHTTHTCLECGGDRYMIRKSANYKTSPNFNPWYPHDTLVWKFECRQCRAGFNSLRLRG